MKNIWFKVLSTTSQTPWLIFLLFCLVGCLSIMVGAGTSDGPLPPDLLFTYPASHVAAFLNQIGLAGRTAYAFSGKIDLIYMTLGTLLLSSILFRIIGGKKLKETKLLALTALPLFVFIFDLIETVGLISASSLYPAISPIQAQAIALATPLKWSSLILVILIGVIVFVKNRIQNSFEN